MLASGAAADGPALRCTLMWSTTGGMVPNSSMLFCGLPGLLWAAMGMLASSCIGIWDHQRGWAS